jgi:NAD(P)-dependent dehydrogenase (short-subunit alcohol dehydrogenase family)
MSSLKNQIAIITGGSSGIGFAISRAVLAEDMCVAIAARDRNRLSQALKDLKDEVKNKDQVIAIPTDVSNAKDVDEMVKQVIQTWGRIDLLVNDAGIGKWSNIEECKEEDWDRVLAVNLKGTFLCTKAVLPQMKRQRSGYIVNVSSIAGKVGMGGAPAYSASKFGVVGLTQSVLEEAIEYNIRATVICPGFVATPMVAGASVPTEEMIPPSDIGKLVIGLLNLSPVTVIKEIVVQRRGAID